MEDSEFIKGMNFGNDDFAKSCAENFNVVSNGIPGQYPAVNIDDMESATAARPGGKMEEGQCLVFVKRSVVEAAKIEDGTILFVRGKKRRVNKVSDDADNTILLTCISATITMKR